MEELIKAEMALIGTRLKTLRENLSIEKKELKDAITISVGTITNIEKGTGFNGDSIIRLAYFFSLTLAELADKNYKIPGGPVLKEKIIAFRELHNLPKLSLLYKAPEIKIVVEQWLLPSGFFDLERTVEEILSKCSEYNFNYSSSSMSNELKKLSVLEKIDRIPSGGRIFLYKKVVKEKD